MTEKVQKVGTTVCLVFVIATIILIIYFGSQDAGATWKSSNAVSGGFFSSLLHGIFGVVQSLFGWTDVYSLTHYDEFVRKFAHFVEYGILGFECAALAFFATQKPCSRLLWMSVFVPLFVACIDEFIQSFVGRSSEVGDVLLDFSGACCGILFVVLVILIWKKLKARS